MSTKKTSVAKKSSIPVKKAAIAIKKAVAPAKKVIAPAKKAAPVKKVVPVAKKAVTPVKKLVAPAKKLAPKKVVSSKPAAKPVEDVITKEALKLVDQAATMLRDGIKMSHKTTAKARTATHKKAHVLLGKATRHLDDAIQSGSTVIRKIINKI